jgi:hypothetical protein
MKTLKHEEVNATIYVDIDDARRRIGAFIENVYAPPLVAKLVEYEEAPSQNQPCLPRGVQSSFVPAFEGSILTE